jgi:hypothetical protein
MVAAVEGIEQVSAQLFQMIGAYLAFDMEHLFPERLFPAMVLNEIGQHDVRSFQVLLRAASVPDMQTRFFMNNNSWI